MRRPDLELLEPRIAPAVLAAALQQAHLVLSASVNDPRAQVGETVYFTVTLRDEGPDAATGVAVSDALPAGLGFVSASPTQGAYDPATGLWAVGSIANGATAQLVIAAEVLGHEAVSNVATVEDVDQPDPDPSHRSASAGVLPVQADLRLFKWTIVPAGDEGRVVVYSIRLDNGGPDAATGVRVQDQLPAGVELIVATTDREKSYDPATGVWTVGDLPVGFAAILSLIVRLPAPGLLPNTASASGDQYDPDPANNTDATSTDPLAADLVLTNIPYPFLLTVGDTVTFNVRLINAGPADAAGVTVKEVLPPGLEFVHASTTQGTYDPDTGLWDVGAMAVGSERLLFLQARAVAAGTATSTASIAGSDRLDPSPQNDSNSATLVIDTASGGVVGIDSLARLGDHGRPTTLAIGFTGPLDPTTARDAANYELAKIGPGGRLLQPVPLSSALYDLAADAVTLAPRARLLALHARYRLVVRSGGVLDADGRPIDGDGDGVPGGDYVRDFGPGILAREGRGPAPGRAREARPFARSLPASWRPAPGRRPLAAAVRAGRLG